MSKMFQVLPSVVLFDSLPQLLINRYFSIFLKLWVATLQVLLLKPVLVPYFKIYVNTNALHCDLSGLFH